MGHADAVIRMNSAHLNKFGVSTTYVPANDAIPSFAWVAALGDVQLDATAQGYVRDVRECWGLQSVLSANGINSPIPARERQKGDSMTIENESGDDESWTVVRSNYRSGMRWIELERNIRVIP